MKRVGGMSNRNKIGRYDALQLLEAKRIVQAVAEYNYTAESNPLYRKLQTIVRKIDVILDHDLESHLQDEYNLLGRL